MSKRYDLVVLGAGPGGYVAAIRGRQLGLTVAVVEKRWWGGVCLNVGCIPSKALLRNAEIAQLLRRDAGRLGITGDFTLDFGAAVRRSRQVAGARARGVHYLMRKHGVDEIHGWGSFRNASSLEVTLEDGSVELLEYGAAIIATGAAPRLLPGTALGPCVTTYEQQIVDETLPRRIVVAGGGPVAVELGWVYAAYGAEVTLVELEQHLLPHEDAEVAAELEKQLRRAGLRVLTRTRVLGIDSGGEVARVTVSGPEGEEVLEGDRVLQAIGFQPRVEGYGLERTAVRLDDRRAIAVDEHMQTNVAGIYAVGDVNGKLMLAHAAQAMGVVAAEHVAGRDPRPLDFDMMPRAVYAEPQVASFGFTETRARDLGHDPVVARFPLLANGKANAHGDAAGFVKLVSDRQSGKLIGAHLVGHGVTELLPELTLARAADLDAAAVARNVHAHPTLGEAVAEAALALDGAALHV